MHTCRDPSTSSLLLPPSCFYKVLLDFLFVALLPLDLYFNAISDIDLACHSNVIDGPDTARADPYTVLP